MSIIFQNPLFLFCIALVATITVIRMSLLISPGFNVYIGRYDVHHLYTGAVLLILDTMFLVAGFINTYTILLAGFASALILDELGYLVTTHVPDRRYFTRASFIEMFVAVIVILVFALLISIF